jgi:hypothetical protein
MPSVRKFAKFKPKPLDEELFQELLHILHSIIYNGNWSATARALGVSTPTAQRWVNNPPKQAHYTMILREVIREITSQLKYSPHKKDKRTRIKALQRMADLKQISISNVETPEQTRESLRLFLATLNEAPGQTMTLQELKKATGLSSKSVRAIALRLEVDSETSGFGSEKQTHYSIPRTEDL